LHIGQGEYDWDPIDKHLRAVEEMTVALADEEVVPKPVLLTLAIYSQLGADRSTFADHSPDWLQEALGGSYMVGSHNCPVQPAPRYDDPNYQAAFRDVIQALGARYEENDRITAVTIAAGYDDETAAIRLSEANGCSYGNLLYGEHVSRERYRDFVIDTMTWYREAFPNTPLYIQAGNAEWEHREAFLAHASRLSPPVGYKPNVIAPDLGAAFGWASSLKGRGFIQMAEAYEGLIPLAYEPKHAPYQIALDARREHAYWMTLNALAHSADFIAYQSFCPTLETSECSWFPYLAAVDEPPDDFGGFTDFVASNLGQTLNTASSVWVVLRDSEHEFNGYSSGEPGDWDRGLVRLIPDGIDASSLVWKEQLPLECRDQIYSRQLRRTGGRPLLLDVADQWSPGILQQESREEPDSYTLRIWYLDQGSDRFEVAYRDTNGALNSQSIEKQGSNRVLVAELALMDLLPDNSLDGGADLIIDDLGDGDEHLHLIWLERNRD
jgi:hypothetical protein